MLQFHFQSQELLQKPSVWEDPPALFDLVDGLQKGEAMVDHEVGQHQRGRATHPDCTVDQHSACAMETHTDCVMSGSRQNMP